MSHKITDPLALMMGVEVTDVRADGITVQADVRPEFCNAYGFAHGGYVYALGHITAALSAELSAGRKCVVADAACQYLSSLKASPATAESQLLRAGKSLLVYRVQVKDALGRVCFTQSVTLKEVDAAPVEFRPQAQTIFADRPGEADPVTGIAYPKVSPFFAKECHVHMVGRGDSGLIYGADLHPETVNCYGAAHGGLIYTACDGAACGSMSVLLEKRPVTVASQISYLRAATVGPIKAEAKLIRDGKQLVFYNIDITDGNGQLVAAAQFTLQGVAFQAAENLGKEYRNRAFKD